MDGEGGALLLRATDAGRTYVAWRWLDRHARPGFHAVDRAELAAGRTALLGSLAHRYRGESPLNVARRVLTSGMFADPRAELHVSRGLGAALLPRPVWELLLREADHGRTPTVRITPSRALARIPWELLVAPGDGRRLIALARLVYEAPAASVHYRRPRLPTPVGRPDRPLRTLEPALPNRARGRLAEVLPPSSRAYLQRELGLSDADSGPVEITRGDLHRLLTAEPAPTRWLYVGHVSSDDDDPGSASLHLSDDARWHSSTSPIRDHRPLSARDLYLGTVDVGDRSERTTYPCADAREGAHIWPMPPRVAIIACNSGADHAAAETFGLVVAALAGGAEHVTSTRWPIPTDHAFRAAGAAPRDAMPTSGLVVAVDRAHGDADADPVDALRTWQIDQLDRWTRTGEVRHTPLLLAGVTTHHAPARPDLRLTGPADS